MPAQLHALNEGPSIWLEKPIMLVGRDMECDIRLDSRKISRRHCCIAQVSDYLVVRDLGSTNGIRINGVRVIEGNLKIGDELTIGSHRFQLRWDSAVVAGKAPVERPVLTPIAPPGVLDDDELESSDEPVPIADVAQPVDAPRALPKNKPLPFEDRQNHKSPPLPKPPAPNILPDHLDLAPPSELAPDLPKLPPSSQNLP